MALPFSRKKSNERDAPPFYNLHERLHYPKIRQNHALQSVEITPLENFYDTSSIPILISQNSKSHQFSSKT